MTVNTNVNLKYPELNADGLATWYGTNEDNVDRGGYVSTMTGQEHCVEFNVDYTDAKLGTDGTHLFVLSYNTFIPKGSYMTRANFLVTSAWDSTSSDVALNFGLIKQSDYTIIDADGLFDSIAKTALDTVGASLTVTPADSLPAATTWVGAELGTIRAENHLVTTFWETHVPTSGAGILRVYYMANLTA